MDKETLNKKAAGELLRKIIHESKEKLNNISDEDAKLKKSPSGWSKKEVIGHLIDSAVINTQRFVRASFQENLIFPGYDQDEGVKLQNYNLIEWKELVNLWYSLNLHLSRVMDSIPDEVRSKEFQIHNLDEIAWEYVSKDKTTTLDYFMNDYIEHLRHHLMQI